jgi:colanic acid biosynthesis glycosyl transferase WcaI
MTQKTNLIVSATGRYSNWQELAPQVAAWWNRWRRKRSSPSGITFRPLWSSRHLKSYLRARECQSLAEPLCALAVRSAYLKFVFLTQYYPPEVGGAQVLMGSLAAEVKRQGHDVRVITALPNYPRGRIFEEYRERLFVREWREGIPVFRTWVYAAQTARLIPRLMNYFSFCLSSFLAFFWMGKPDFIFVDSPPLFLAFTAFLFAKAKGARWIMNISDLWPDAVEDSGLVQSGILMKVAKWMEAFLYRRADFVGTVTEGIQTILKDVKGLSAQKLLFLPIGVDTTLFQPRNADESLIAKHRLREKSVFVYAGTLGHAQGLPLLLDAADALRERQDIALVLVGDGPVKAQLQAERDERKLSSVVFADAVPLAEMPRWWSVARGALVPLKDQPIHQSARPSKSLPAMASGVPVIFSGQGEMARILNDAQAGIVIPPERRDPLVECIIRLTDDDELVRKLGENGRRLCVKEFSWETIVHRWLSELTEKSLPKYAH